MTDHFEFNFEKPTKSSSNTVLDNIIEFPLFSRKETSAPPVFVLSEKYRVPDASLRENS